MTLTSKKLADLRTRAEKASPGPWTIRCRNSKYYNGDTHVALEEVIERFDPTDINDQNFLGACLRGPEEAGRGDFTVMDAAFIAAFNPYTALKLLDWIDELERHAEADAANAKHMRSQLSEALANEQSSAKAYAESQAREAVYRTALQRAVAPHIEEFCKERAREALSLPAPDLVGVIKKLAATVEWMRDECGYASPVWIKMNNALESTREIRERIGAT